MMSNCQNNQKTRRLLTGKLKQARPIAAWSQKRLTALADKVFILATNAGTANMCPFLAFALTTDKCFTGCRPEFAAVETRCIRWLLSFLMMCAVWRLSTRSDVVGTGFTLQHLSLCPASWCSWTTLPFPCKLLLFDGFFLWRICYYAAFPKLASDSWFTCRRLWIRSDTFRSHRLRAKVRCSCAV